MLLSLLLQFERRQKMQNTSSEIKERYAHHNSPRDECETAIRKPLEQMNPHAGAEHGHGNEQNQTRS
jgi:hypothetical protein